MVGAATGGCSISPVAALFKAIPSGSPLYTLCNLFMRKWVLSLVKYYITDSSYSVKKVLLKGSVSIG